MLPCQKSVQRIEKRNIPFCREVLCSPDEVVRRFHEHQNRFPRLKKRPQFRKRVSHIFKLANDHIRIHNRIPVLNALGYESQCPLSLRQVRFIPVLEEVEPDRCVQITKNALIPELKLGVFHRAFKGEHRSPWIRKLCFRTFGIVEVGLKSGVLNPTSTIIAGHKPGVEYSLISLRPQNPESFRKKLHLFPQVNCPRRKGDLDLVLA